jgi:hypothetical protein
MGVCARATTALTHSPMTVSVTTATMDSNLVLMVGLNLSVDIVKWPNRRIANSGIAKLCSPPFDPRGWWRN